VRQGHTLDTNTLALWRLNEGRDGAVDLTGAYPLSCGLGPRIVPGQIATGRKFVGDSSVYLEGAGNAAAVTALLGDCSVELWAWISSVQSADDSTHRKYLVTYGGASNTSDQNHLVAVALYTVTGVVEISYEDNTHIDAASWVVRGTTPIPRDQWVHIAVTKAVVGGTATWSVYLNGVLDASSAGWALPQGGTNSIWSLGRYPNYANNAYALNGGLEDVRISNVARSAAEVAASYAAGYGRAGGPSAHALDGSTFALWRFDEAMGRYLDSCVGARHFTEVTPGFGLRRTGLVRGYGLFSTVDNLAASYGTDATLRATLEGSWSVEFWIDRCDQIPAAGANVLWHATVVIPPLALDDQILLGVYVQQDGRISTVWSNGATGANTVIAPTKNCIPAQGKTHVAVTKHVEADTTVTLNYYLDGVLDSTQTGLPNVSHGSGSNGSLEVCAFPSNHLGQFYGLLDDLRLSNVARSAAEVAASYAAGADWSGPVDTTLPTVSNVTPSSGTTIAAGDPIGFDITDAGGNLAQSNVVAYYPATGAWEVVYWGAISGAWGSRAAGFAPLYSGAVAAITNGLRFSGVVRVGGWPAAPAVTVAAGDTAGNVNS
jgi:hypothetical protein